MGVVWKALDATLQRLEPLVLALMAVGRRPAPGRRHVVEHREGAAGLFTAEQDGYLVAEGARNGPRSAFLTRPANPIIFEG
jgi:hypothetical protein